MEDQEWACERGGAWKRGHVEEGRVEERHVKEVARANGDTNL